MAKKNSSIDSETIEKILSELKEMEVMCTNDRLTLKIQKLIKTVNNAANWSEEISVEDIIHKKMKESAKKNPDLNLKLYMLYRDLSDGRISEEKAKELYETYIQMYPDDIMIY
ncbi:hypothetical protein OW763_10025 [Clostridium aestuarii]|uniref:Uncharacterized protein n=1 Tax=Clostridium aestuarii TaxID=338193 RepID=A0ABT4D0Q1_9CLOT|nr:hypothetical protein [Clostridium aestuarii]MCY6484677.1 hypothetical protein [Clostridium aestuarii]